MIELKAIPAAPGIAIGPLFVYKPEVIAAEGRPALDAASEWARLEGVLPLAEAQLQGVKAKALQEADAGTAAIFDAQAAMLRDPELLELARKDLQESHTNVEAAWRSATEHFAAQLENIEDAYLQARAADLRDVAQRVLRLLAGAHAPVLDELTSPCIILAADLTPSDTVMLDKTRVLGFCTAAGGETSHTAILARSLGIPAVVGAGTSILDLPTTGAAILSGSDGLLLVDPPPDELARWNEKKVSRDKLHAGALIASREPAVTTDGTQVEIVANIGNARDAQAALDKGAEGVGLLRTEFLYLERSAIPDEAEQLDAYRAILDVFGEQPVVLRTLDIGGDKAVPYLGLAPESNPFLGVRGLRLCLLRPDLFRPQLRAALQAAAGHNLKIMFPMVATLEEVLAARQEVENCRQELERQGRSLPQQMEIGIMVEVPSAALLAEHIAPAVDFFSIGTNDLTQYTLATDRTNPQLAHLASAFSPAVLKLIDWVVQAGHQHNKWVGICGELAGEPQAIPILLGLGVDELSMNAPAIPLAKQIVRSLSLDECRGLARQALSLQSPQQVKELVAHTFPHISV